MPEIIYTSYFAKAENFDRNKYALISIAGKAPDGWQYIQYKKLAPSWSIWKEWHDNTPVNKKGSRTRYIHRFVWEILARLNPQDVLNRIRELAGNKTPVLFCYERPGDFCHRHIIAKWLTKFLNADGNNLTVAEYDFAREKGDHDGN